MASLDLNQLRNTLRENARRGEARPDEPRRKIVVDRDGKIRHGDDVGCRDRRELSEVPQELFAALGDLLRNLFVDDRDPPSLTRYGDHRLDRDRASVRDKLPWGTTEVTVEGTTGFVYDIVDEFGAHYRMVVYFDGSEYQVKVVEPEIEGHYGVTNAHVFGDGRLCLRPPAGGMPTLAEAYAKSVLWATGFTVLRRGGEFPWPSH